MKQKIVISSDIPQDVQSVFVENYETITDKIGNLFLFSCDQKIEHLNEDFYSTKEKLPDDAVNPEHLFSIASHGRIGAMASHLGLIARYGKSYPFINYIVKINGKTNSVPVEQKEPNSAPLWDAEQVALFKKQSDLPIRGIGITVYIGSEYEQEMLTYAAQQINRAHQNGLVAILWMYLRGKAVTDDRAHELIAGACGVAASLGADFVKIKAPRPTKELSSVDALKIAVQAAGNTKVICSGGKKRDPKLFLEELHNQMHIGGTAGTATGRNVFQQPLPDAIAMTYAISSIVYDDANTDKALALYEEVRKKGGLIKNV